MNDLEQSQKNRITTCWRSIRRLLRDHATELAGAAALVGIVHGTAATALLCLPLLH